MNKFVLFVAVKRRSLIVEYLMKTILSNVRILGLYRLVWVDYAGERLRKGFWLLLEDKVIYGNFGWRWLAV